MNLEVYWVAVALTGAASAISHLQTINPVIYTPVDPKPFSAITGLSALAFFALVIGGFFLFNWQAPLIGLVITAIATPFLKLLATATPFYPIVTMIIGVAGLLSGVAVFIV